MDPSLSQLLKHTISMQVWIFLQSYSGKSFIGSVARFTMS